MATEVPPAGSRRVPDAEADEPPPLAGPPEPGGPRLVRALDEAREAERRTIAAGIHDHTLQNLGALTIRLQLIRRRSSDEELRAEVDQALALIGETGAQLRSLLFDLRPLDLDHGTLAAHLREDLEVRLGPELDAWSVTGEVGPPTPAWVQRLLHRIAQQALANVREHAHARRVTVALGSDDRHSWMVVTDDGRGFDADAALADPEPGHIGLRTMRDRAQAVGGRCRIESSPGAGTVVRVDLPQPSTPAGSP
jgi:signal transduction histidine kinase